MNGTNSIALTLEVKESRQARRCRERHDKFVEIKVEGDTCPFDGEPCSIVWSCDDVLTLLFDVPPESWNPDDHCARSGFRVITDE
jgi:hypothetical protein